MANKKSLAKIITTLAVAIILMVTFQGMNFIAYQSDFYAPGAIFVREENLESSSVRIFGNVCYMNESYTPVIFVSVRLWATDELFEEVVVTDDNGKYSSLKQYKTGQLISIKILNQKFIRFVSYYAIDSYELDPIFIII